MRNNKGITLIALIITIIVMLILVGVSVSVALNGGLFDRAERARDDTRREAEKEKLLEIAMGALDTTTVKVNRDQLEANLPSGWTMDAGGPPYICTSPSGNKYMVKENGTVTAASTEREEIILNSNGITSIVYDRRNMGRLFRIK